MRLDCVWQTLTNLVIQQEPIWFVLPNIAQVMRNKRTMTRDNNEMSGIASCGIIIEWQGSLVNVCVVLGIVIAAHHAFKASVVEMEICKALKHVEYTSKSKEMSRGTFQSHNDSSTWTHATQRDEEENCWNIELQFSHMDENVPTRVPVPGTKVRPAQTEIWKSQCKEVMEFELSAVNSKRSSPE